MGILNKTKNRFGMDIVECCASCKHNVGIVNDDYRQCEEGEGKVLHSSWCSQWVMKTATEKDKLGVVNLDNAGKGGGRIKKKSYLKFMLECTSYDHPLYLAPLEVKRSAFEERYGSIYLNKK